MKSLTAVVVVSTYNQEKYIIECLDSILNQKTDYKFKVLISDDCSKDRTPAIIQDYQERFKDQVEIILHEKNQGAAKNYLELHLKAVGDIVFHMDGDDIMLPGKIQKQCQAFENPNVNFCLHSAYYFNDARTSYKPTGNLSLEEPVTLFTATDLAGWGTISVHSSYAYRKSSRQTFELNREFMEWFFAMDSLKSGGLGAFINEPLLEYRFNVSGNSYLSSQAGKLKAYNLYLFDLKIYFEQFPALRTRLYANAFITFLGILKNTRTVSKNYFLFLLKNVFYFRLSYMSQSFAIRKKMAPREQGAL